MFPSLAFDIDGVLADFHSSFNAAIIRHLGPVLPVGSIPEDGRYDAVLSSSALGQVKRACFAAAEFWLSMAEHQREVAALRHFIRQNPRARIFYVTARPPSRTVKAATLQWLAARDLLPAAAQVHLVGHSLKKAASIETLGISRILDDDPSVVLSCGERAVLLARPWNRWGAWPGVRRVVRDIHEFTAAA